MDISGTFSPFRDMSPEQVRTWIREKKTAAFTLLDVRQPAEYQAGHIPGAVLVPLPELPDRLAEIDHTRPVVVYCRSGNRSRSAASLIAGDNAEVFNMAGGMLAWQGLTATGPVEAGLHLVQGRTSEEQLLALAWALEEGAGQFYQGVADRMPREEERKLFLGLVIAEDGHKRKVLDAWRAATGREPADTALRQELSGVMEGGYRVHETLNAVKDRGSREMLELAMQIETNSLDLYSKIIRWTGSIGARDIFLQLVQEEKKHLESLGRLLEELSSAA